MDILKFNKNAWDKQVGNGNPWTLPVTSEQIQAARQGRWAILLTSLKPVPRDWLPEIAGKTVLCLAAGGGQQGPILAAAGAQVTVLDNSPKQLEQDRRVADREGLIITTVEGEMADLSMFRNESFNIIVHPVSNIFVPDIQPVWKEAYRVLQPNGILLAGFDNPAKHLFDFEEAARTGKMVVKHALPYSDAESLTEATKRKYRNEGIPLEFSHTLEAQIGGQIEAGFTLAGFYEDYDKEGDCPLRDYMPTYIATRAIKLKRLG